MLTVRTTVAAACEASKRVGTWPSPARFPRGLGPIRRACAGTSTPPSSSSSPAAGFPRESEGLAGGLYVVATPIGNLSDMTFRALQVLREADEILAEDTRHTRKLLSALEVRADRRLSSYHEHNKLDKLDKVDLLASNPTRSVALVCDAGTPTVSDPGSELVHRARTLGVRVHCVPGPCAFAAALSASGCVSKMDVHFVGFLPQKAKQLKRKLLQMSEIEAVHAVYVAPHDLVQQLEAMAACGFAGKRVTLAREVTKKFEEFWRGTLEDAIAEFTEEREPRGEFTLLLENPMERGPGAEATEEAEAAGGTTERVLGALIEGGMHASEAAKALAEISQFPLKKKALYNTAVRLSKAQ